VGDAGNDASHLVCNRLVRLPKHFRESEPRPHGFAVGLVSVMAGTLLAAGQVMGDLKKADAIRKGNRSVFQF
jgi:hypothetical protein